MSKPAITQWLEITYGVVTKSEVPSHQVGSHLFTVDLVADDGFRVLLWDGQSYDEAILQTQTLAVEFECEVYDEVVE